jgi:hypothetical protein
MGVSAWPCFYDSAFSLSIIKRIPRPWFSLTSGNLNNGKMMKILPHLLSSNGLFAIKNDAENGAGKTKQTLPPDVSGSLQPV